jgi:hypothetical protein
LNWGGIENFPKPEGVAGKFAVSDRKIGHRLAKKQVDFKKLFFMKLHF